VHMEAELGVAVESVEAVSTVGGVDQLRLSRTIVQNATTPPPLSDGARIVGRQEVEAHYRM